MSLRVGTALVYCGPLWYTADHLTDENNEIFQTALHEVREAWDELQKNQDEDASSEVDENRHLGDSNEGSDGGDLEDKEDPEELAAVEKEVFGSDVNVIATMQANAEREEPESVS